MLAKMFQLLLPFLATTVGLGGAAKAEWILINTPVHPNAGAPDVDSCGITSFASADADSYGHAAIGEGEAYEAHANCSVQAQQSRTGSDVEVWKWVPEEGEADEGEVEHSALVSAQGEVILQSGNVAGAALGYALMQSELFLSDIWAAPEDSAGETSENLLGEVQIEIPATGASITIPISADEGHGDYNDSQNDSDAGERCSIGYRVKSRTQAKTHVYANDGLIFNAYVETYFTSLCEIEYWHNECPL